LIIDFESQNKDLILIQAIFFGEIEQETLDDED